MAKRAIKRRPWLKKEIAELRKLAQKKTLTRQMAKKFGRTIGAPVHPASLRYEAYVTFVQGSRMSPTCDSPTCSTAHGSWLHCSSVRALNPSRSTSSSRVPFHNGSTR
jgi:hypothetical protein